MLAADKDHKKAFPEVLIVETRNGKNLKDYLLTAALAKMDSAGDSEPSGKDTCQVCDHRITSNTFTTKAFGEVFKFQSKSLKCNSEKVLYLLRYKFVMILSMFEKLKQSLIFGLIAIKVNTDLFKKKKRMYYRSAFIHTIFKIAKEVLMIGK